MCLRLVKQSHLSEHNLFDHSIDLVEGKKPPFRPLYPMSLTELKALHEYITKNLEAGLIHHSSSSAVSAMMFVLKKDSTLQPVINYQDLNSIMIKNQYPLPLITEALNWLSSAKIFSKLDIKNAYNQIRIKEGDEWKTVFWTWFDLFEYLILSFELMNAPAFFQSYINQALSDYLNVFCIVYLNNILIYSDNEVEHVEHVQKVLVRLLMFELYVKLSKCEFHVREIGFLDFQINTEGIFMEQSQINTIVKWLMLKSVKDVQQFLEFTNFYRHFIQGYSLKAITLHKHIKSAPLARTRNSKGVKQLNTKTQLSETAQQLFWVLKDTFIQAPLMKHFDKFLPAWVEVDASGDTVAAILTQQHQFNDEAHWHPVTYWSRKLEPAEQNYETGEQEMLTIVSAFTQWRHYLKGVKFQTLVLTDHTNLWFFMMTTKLSCRQAQWAEKLSAFDFWVKYRAGKKNPADELSRQSDYC